MIPDGVHGDKFGRADRSSWAPVDLTPIVANGDDLEPPPVMLARSDGERLLYAGKIHWFAGEPESAKGWLALGACVERIQKGEHVLYIDFEDEATTVVSRLLALGLEREAIIERFHYIRPDEPLTDAGFGQVHEELSIYEPTLAVIDGMTDALALHGIDLRDNTEVANWMRGLPMMLRDRGMAVVITDHVIKDSESRGRWSIGAQHKLAKTDVQYRLKVEKPLGRGLVGRVLVRVEKDRPGHVRRIANGKTVAELIASSNRDGDMVLELQPVDTETGTFRPTGYMEKVSRAVEAEPGLSIRKVREAVPGGNEYIDRALEVLVRDEWMEMRKEGAAQCHYVLRPYREAEDPDRAGNRAEIVPNAPPGEHSTNRATVPPPIGGTGHGGGDTVPRHASQETKEPPPSSDHSLFGDRVEGRKRSDDGYRRLTEEEYAERFRAREKKTEEFEQLLEEKRRGSR
jgi:AAA domain